LLDGFDPIRDEDSELALQIRLISRVMCGWLPLELGYNKMVESDLLNKLLCKSTTLMEEEFDLSDPNDFDNFMSLNDLLYILQSLTESPHHKGELADTTIAESSIIIFNKLIYQYNE
jgi:hypothetical protein